MRHMLPASNEAVAGFGTEASQQARDPFPAITPQQILGRDPRSSQSRLR